VQRWPLALQQQAACLASGFTADAAASAVNAALNK
jgi:hypothetical protein